MTGPEIYAGWLIIGAAVLIGLALPTKIPGRPLFRPGMAWALVFFAHAWPLALLIIWIDAREKHT